jgi:hypothetical protein
MTTTANLAVDLGVDEGDVAVLLEQDGEPAAGRQSAEAPRR